MVRFRKLKCEARCEVESMDIRVDKDHSIVEKQY